MRIPIEQIKSIRHTQTREEESLWEVWINFWDQHGLHGYMIENQFLSLLLSLHKPLPIGKQAPCAFVRINSIGFDEESLLIVTF